MHTLGWAGNYDISGYLQDHASALGFNIQRVGAKQFELQSTDGQAIDLGLLCPANVKADGNKIERSELKKLLSFWQQPIHSTLKDENPVGEKPSGFVSKIRHQKTYEDDIHAYERHIKVIK